MSFPDSALTRRNSSTWFKRTNQVADGVASVRPVRVTVSLAAILALVGLVAAGCGGSSAAKIQGPPTTASTSGFAGAALLPPRPAEPIALHDAEGRAVTLAGQRGRYVLVTFLYTHCLDVCPLIAANLNTALRTIGPERRNVRVLAVSVDPTGDTRAAVRAYVKRMHLLPQFRYLIGTRAELHRVWVVWHVLAVARKADVVDHIAYTALVDPTGKERVLYNSQVKSQQVVHDLRRLLRSAY
jgi:protein SCO1/2